MRPISLVQLQAILDAELRPTAAGEAVVQSIAIDSRGLGSRPLFFALAGEQTDGHRFVRQALAAGAVAAVVARECVSSLPPGDGPLIVVESPLAALQKLASWWRDEFAGRVVAITGSNGKTIAKDALVGLLEERYACAGTLGSYNSQLGVPLATLRIPAAVDFAILEAGISAPGEMARLERILRPDFGILTNIGMAHIAAFGDRMTLAREKVTLFAGIPATGWLLVPAGDPVVEQATADLSCRVVEFGAPSDAVPFVADASSNSEGLRIRVRFPDGSTHDVQTATPSREIVADLEAVIAAAHLLGMPADAIVTSLAGFRPSRTRLEIMRSSSRGITLINDSCSSDPVSVRTALRSLANLSDARGRRVFVFGGMRELGDLDASEHAAVGRLAAEHRVDHLVLVGDGSEQTGPAFAAATTGGTVVRTTPAALSRHLEATLRPGDVVLFKGPRETGIDRAAAEVMAAISPNRLLVDLQAIAENIRVFRRLVGRDRLILGMVKGLAYGSDVTRLGVELDKLGVDYLGVATADEGEMLRRAGVEIPILVTLTTAESAHTVAAHRLLPVLHSPGLVGPLARAARELGRQIQVHIEVDTGMGRLGVYPDAAAALARAATDAGLEVTGLMTHFASAELSEHDELTNDQLRRFADARAALAAAGFTDLVCHAAATAAAVRFPAARFDMVRIGIGLYGVYPSPAVATAVELTLAVSLLSRIAEVREFPIGARLGYGGTFVVDRPGFRAAVLPLGYHDGLPWTSSNAGFVLVAGQRAAIVGRVSMDSALVDVTDIADARVGSDVIVYGTHDGSTLRPEAAAAAAGTMAYELLSRVSSLRIQRIFVGA